MIEDLWYKNAVIYSLDLKTFMDLNEDGVGDFEGLANRLDYLHALGVDTVWLAPFQLSPNRDNGYDIQDYYTVDPRHGTIGNFVEFMHHAKKRGIKVIIDLVINHTSDQHPWFQQARDPKNKLHDWYVWSKEKPEDSESGVVFQGVQQTTWSYDKKAKAYYFHRFYSFQPDLNIENQQLRDEIHRIIGFWLQLGVAGFRVDAVPFLIESPKTNEKKSTMQFDYLRRLRQFIQWRRGDAIMLGEANVLPEENEKYFGNEGDQLNMMFNFYVNQYLFYALATCDATRLKEAIEATRVSFSKGHWAHFLRNHDELDLGRLSKEEMEKVYSRFGPPDEKPLYGRGIRRRLSTMLGNRPQIELANSLLFSLPGTPVIRYGDELGMGDDLELEERNAVRTPMQWSGDANGGFSKAEELVHPVIDKGPYSYKHVNVETQRRIPDSLLNWMTSLIRLRHECVEIGMGEWEIVDVEETSILCMYYHWKGSSIVVIHNFDEKALEINVDLADKEITGLVDLMALKEVKAEDGKFSINMDAYGYRWFRTAGMSHSMKKV